MTRPVALVYNIREGMPHRLYQVAVRHAGLNAYRVISGTDWYTVNMKARVQYDAWEHEWRRRQAHEVANRAHSDDVRRREASKAKRAASIQKCIQWAESQTADARSAVAEVEGTLKRALEVDNPLDWDSLLDRSDFSTPRPEPPVIPPPADVPSPGEAPDPNDARYRPSLGVIGRLSAGRREAKLAEAAARLDQDRSTWAAAVTRARAARDANAARYDAERRRIEKEHAKRVAEWDRERSLFFAERAERNATLAERRRKYEEGEPDAVVEYCHMVLARSDYPDAWPRDVAIEIADATGGVVVDLTLPPVSALPDVESVRYDPQTGRFAVQRLSAARRTALHEALLFQIPLRTVHELFKADRAEAIPAVAVNGWIRAGDVGGTHDRCVVSLSVDRATFEALSLSAADPAAAFKALGGVGWSEHYNLDAVAPLLESQQSRAGDAPAGRATASMYGGLGLEAMSVDDFEHLTRELVECEVATDDERVSIARVDGGVDALVMSERTRRARVLVHARRAAGSCAPDAIRALREAAEIESAAEKVFITTEIAAAHVRDVAASFGIALIDGPRLINLLAHHAGRVAFDMRETGSIRAVTRELESGG